MKCTSKTMLVSTVLDSIKTKKIKLDHPIQRKPGQFSKQQKSLFIDSVLRDYPIPPIYLLEEKKNTYLIDGLQRLTTIQEYFNDEFKLSSNLDDLSYSDGTTSFVESIARKTFSKLPVEFQSIIKNRELTVYTLEDCTETEINDIFLRLNNGVPLNSSQKLKASMSTDVQKRVNEIKNLDLFTKISTLSDSNRLKGLDDSCVVQLLMLHKGNCNFTKSAIAKFLNSYVYDPADFDSIKTASEELGKLLPKDLKGLSRITLPLVVNAYMTCDDDNKDIYINKVKDFFENYDLQTDYKELCMYGTTSKHNVEERLQFFVDMQK